MKAIFSNVGGWLAAVVFVAVVTVVWSGASVLVFLSGNRTLSEQRG